MPEKEPFVTIPLSILQDYQYSIELMTELLMRLELEGEDEERGRYVARLIQQNHERIVELIKTKK